MYHHFDEEKYEELRADRANRIIGDKTHLLPHMLSDFGTVEIFLTERSCVVVESRHHPIRHGRNCGTRVHLGAHYGKIDYNPKFIWNGKEWHLNTFGTFLFAEVEISGS